MAWLGIGLFRMTSVERLSYFCSMFSLIFQKANSGLYIGLREDSRQENRSRLSLLRPRFRTNKLWGQSRFTRSWIKADDILQECVLIFRPNSQKARRSYYLSYWAERNWNLFQFIDHLNLNQTVMNQFHTSLHNKVTQNRKFIKCKTWWGK